MLRINVPPDLKGRTNIGALCVSLSTGVAIPLTDWYKLYETLILHNCREFIHLQGALPVDSKGYFHFERYLKDKLL